MALFKYFSEERFAVSFIEKGLMRFGSLSHFRRIEDGGVRGDPKDGTLHYAPDDGLEITMVADGRKLKGQSLSTAAQNMFVFCMSSECSNERAEEFGKFCVEITDVDRLITRLRMKASRSSKLDYDVAFLGETEYRQLNKIPGVDWAFPEKVVLIKPPEYVRQREFRVVLPIKAAAYSTDDHVDIEIGNLAEIAKLVKF